MSLLGKLSLCLSGLSLIILTSTALILGGWIPIFNGILVFFFVGIITSLIIDRRLYLGFLLMKTTKNGVSIGASIVITLIFCFSLGYLSKRFETSIDITKEQINSLAPQTQKILSNLKHSIKFIIFYQGSMGYQKKSLVKRNLLLFKLTSSKIKAFYYDAYVENKLAQKYLNNISQKDKQDIFVFVEYNGNKVLIESPFNEEKITTAIIKATRREKRAIYFLSGHGEKDLLNSSGAGISLLKSALIGSSFKVKAWNLIINGKLPKDISTLVIAGPKQSFLEKELQWIEQYLKSGGKILLALDPKTNTNLTQLLKKFSVNYKNHFIKDGMARLVGLGAFSALGIYFDAKHMVTQSIPSGSIFISHLTSDLEIINNDLFLTTALIKTDTRAESIKNINKNNVTNKKASHIMGLLVESKKPENKKQESKKQDSKKQEGKTLSSMKLAVFGDSDFLSNHLINKGINRDISLNVISYLADETDLVSIRPKKLKSTSLVLKQSDKITMLLLVIALPIICFIISLVIWFRRREA